MTYADLQEVGPIVASVARPFDALRGHGNAVTQAEFSPDGARIVTASEDRTARLWDTDTGKPVFKLEGHTGSVTHARFSPDGKRIVTASEDNTARRWPTTYLEGLRWACRSVKGSLWPLPEKYKDLTTICDQLPM